MRGGLGCRPWSEVGPDAPQRAASAKRMTVSSAIISNDQTGDAPSQAIG